MSSLSQVLGIPYRALCASDRKTSARTFMQLFHQDVLSHLYVENESAIQGDGMCSLHGRSCQLDPAVRPHVASAGFPCQLFSPQRHRGGTTARSGGPVDHPDYATVMDDWLRYIRQRMPECFFIEEVPAFAEAGLDGKTFLGTFIRQCVQEKYAIRVYELDHALWCNFPRARLP